MNCNDVHKPGDADLKSLLVFIAQRTQDRRKRDAVLNLILTLPPLREWPTEWLLRMKGAISFGTSRN